MRQISQTCIVTNVWQDNVRSLTISKTHIKIFVLSSIYLFFLHFKVPTKDMRFAGGSPTEGRVEVYYDGLWGTMCKRGFTENEVNAVCKVMGYRYVHYTVPASVLKAFLLS